MALGDPRQPVDTDALLHHPDVVRVIRAILVQFGIHDQDLEDGIADVQKKALESKPKGKRPTTIADWKKLVRKIAPNVGRDILRKLYARGQWNSGPTDGADDHAASDGSLLEPHELALIRSIVEEVRREQAGGKHTDVMLAGMMTGAPPREMAKEAGIPSGQMRKKTSDLRILLRGRLLAVGISVAGAALICWGSVAGYEHHQAQVQAASFDANCAAPPAVPKTLEPPRERDIPDVDKAAVLRDRAAEDCAQKDYGACAEDLERASFYDPAGDKLPAVKALRDMLNRMYSTKPR